MLDGWYCRTLASEQAAQQTDKNEQNIDANDDTDSESQDESHNQGPANAAVDYKTQYRYLKRKLKFLIYENEFFQDALRSNQRRLLKVSRDRAFLLDRLLQYEKPENTSSESEETEESSEDETTKEMKRRKSEQGTNGTTVPRGRKKKVAPAVSIDTMESKTNHPLSIVSVDDHQQTHAEVERQLSKRPVIDLIPERAPTTVPAEMFSNEPSLDSEPNDNLIECSSPTHVAAEECVPMEYSN